MADKELLDYCRVKKIFEKGFGFLTSLHFEENVFFHFSKIKNESVREKLSQLKRGEVYLFYTSFSKEGKRKAEKIWINIKDVDDKLIPDFVDRILLELNEGKINPFELATVVKILRSENYITNDSFKQILNSNKVVKTPTIINSMFQKDEIERLGTVANLIDSFENLDLRKNLIEELIAKLYR